jgi:hypothetical protein
MTKFPPDVMDFVLEAGPDSKSEGVYVQVDGEFLNIFREHGFGTDFARLFITDTLKKEYGPRLHIHIVKASTGRQITEPPRTRGQIRRERRAAVQHGFDWAPTEPYDEASNPVVVIGNVNE